MKPWTILPQAGRASVVLCALAACGCADHTELPNGLRSYHLTRVQRDDPSTKKPIIGGESRFALVFQFGSVGWYWTLRVAAADGSCELFFPEQGAGSVKYRHCRFVVSGEDIKSLRNTLQRAEVVELATLYDSGAKDGEVMFLSVSADGAVKEVACNQHFPSRMVDVYDFVVDTIIERNRGACASADRVDDEMTMPRLGSRIPRRDITGRMQE